MGITVACSEGAVDVAGKGEQLAPCDRPSTRQGLLRLAGFATLILVMTVSMNVLIGVGVRRVKTSSLGTWNAMMQGRVNADILISGSSRATYHYDPRIIAAVTHRSAFNIGRVASQTDLQAAVLKAYLEHNRKPSIVIQNLDAFTFVTTREIYEPAQYVPYLRDRELYDSLHKMDPNLLRSKIVPLYGYVVDDMNYTWFVGLKALAGLPSKDNYVLGFSPQDRVWGDEFQGFKKRMPQGVSFGIEPGGVQALEDVIEICQKNGIQLVLVYSPEYSEMQAMTNNRHEIFARFQELAERYDVPFWDYSGWMHNGDRRYFYNSQHLNAEGANLFSEDLAKHLAGFLDHNQDAPQPVVAVVPRKQIGPRN